MTNDINIVNVSKVHPETKYGFNGTVPEGFYFAKKEEDGSTTLVSYKILDTNER